MHKAQYFNLIASIISDSITFSEHNSFDDLEAEYERTLTHKVEDIIQTVFTNNQVYAHYNLPVDSQKLDVIINQYRENNNYYLNKFLVSRLDSLVDMDVLKQDICINRINSSGHKTPIEGLNNNISDTGIIIMPKFQKPVRTHEKKDPDGTDKTLVTKEADYWSDEINAAMQNLYYINTNDLDGFKIRNIFIDSFEANDSSLRIGYTPILNDHTNNIMTFDDNIIKEDDKKNKKLYFGNVNLLNPSYIEEKFLSCYGRACREKINIIFAPEMLGTERLSSTDNAGYNNLFTPKEENDYYTPLLTLTPTYWHDNKNVLSIFYSGGKKIAEQYKQNGFKFKGKHGKCTEDLSESPKEITIVHIDGIGRLAFPICADYLNEKYRNILIVNLKASLIICPSYSFGTSNFEQLVTAGSAYGVRCIWGNSCSALSDIPEPPNYPCLVSTPIISKSAQKVRIKRKCRKKCRKICVFKIDIPLVFTGKNLYEDINIKYQHLFE